MTGPRYSIIPADAYSDERMKDLHVRVLGILGTHTNNNGWCEVNQRVIAEKCGRTRETINRVIRDLCEFGFLSKQEQKTKANGRTINLYQVLMDRPAKPLDVAPPVTSGSHGAVTPEDHNPCDAATSQLNDPSLNDKKEGFSVLKDRAASPPDLGLVVAGPGEPEFDAVARLRRDQKRPAPVLGKSGRTTLARSEVDEALAAYPPRSRVAASEAA